MKSLFLAILRTALVIVIGMVGSAAIALWVFSGKTPTNMKEIREATKELANFHEVKKKMVERSFYESEKIKDDSELPAGINSETMAEKAAEDALMTKLNEEIAQATKGAAQERDQEYKKEIGLLKNKLAGLQAQLDRIENQNRVLTLQISGLVKDGKVQKR